MTTPGLNLALSSLLLVLLFSPGAHALGCASTIAIADGTGTVCGVLAGASPRSIRCALGSSQSFPVLPNISFASISGGRDFFCGLRSGGNSFFCWNAINSSSANLTPKRLYNEAAVLEDLTVGEDQISAFQNGTGIRWWRGNGEFPTTASGVFRSLTSGDGFSCAISTNNSRVKCWGSRNGIGDEIEAGFANISMSTIVAGASHACGINTAGFLNCKGRNESGQLEAPSGTDFSALALGQTHSCAIRTANGTVVCWGGDGNGRGGDYFPVNDTSVVLIVAGGNLTCGLTTGNYSVICWGTDRVNRSATVLPLPKILPGFCTDEGSCSCGVFPDSNSLCSGSGVICSSCGVNNPQAIIPSPPSPLPPSPSPSAPSSKGWVAFAIVGSVGIFVGICAVAFCFWNCIGRQKKVHNSVQPTITGAGNGGGPNNAGAAAAAETVAAGALATPFSSPSRSRSRSMSMIFRRQGSRRVMRRQRSGPSSMKHTDRAEEFSLSDLAAATKNFALETKIGAGSFGTVYKGKLSDGREVAIKRSETGPRSKKFQEKETAFQSELAFLSRLHHKHLVGFVGYCEEKEERLLVYEYMKNGALYDHLHGKEGNGNTSSDGTSNGGVLNSWTMRIKILLDAARGIEYLHNYAVPPIIHRDIKSSNILLDGNWTARVSDFGLSLNGPETEGEHLTMRAAGTVGYMDPEYYGLHHLTVKSDVYGLGVVMLEVLTGKRAIFKDGGDGHPISVVDYAVPRIVEGELGKVLDPRVGPPGMNEAEAVELVAYMAVHCVSLEGRERPTMTDVVANFESALALCDHSHGSISSNSISLASCD